MSRDLHKVDVCVANPETGEVKTLIEERMNTYIETKPLRLIEQRRRNALLERARRLGPLVSVTTRNGTLKNQITSGEFVTEDSSIHRRENPRR